MARPAGRGDACCSHSLPERVNRRRRSRTSPWPSTAWRRLGMGRTGHGRPVASASLFAPRSSRPCRPSAWPPHSGCGLWHRPVPPAVGRSLGKAWVSISRRPWSSARAARPARRMSGCRPAVRGAGRPRPRPAIPGRFDLVFFYGSLEHIGEQGRAVEQAVSLLRPEGTPRRRDAPPAPPARLARHAGRSTWRQPTAAPVRPRHLRGWAARCGLTELPIRLGGPAGLGSAKRRFPLRWAAAATLMPAFLGNLVLVFRNPPHHAEPALAGA